MPGLGDLLRSEVRATALLKMEACRKLLIESDDAGRLPLHWAAEHDHHLLVELIVNEMVHDWSFNAHVNQPGWAGFTAFGSSVLEANVRTVDVLLRHGEIYRHMTCPSSQRLRLTQGGLTHCITSRSRGDLGWRLCVGNGSTRSFGRIT